MGADKWAVAEPAYTWTPENNMGELDYDISTAMVDENANVVIYDGECGVGGNVQTAGFLTTITGIGNETDGIGGENFLVDGKTAEVDIVLDLPTLAESDLYAEDPNSETKRAAIIFCIRFSLETTTAPSLEVNFLENVITLNIDLQAGFTVDAFDVAPKEKIEATATQTYEVDAKRCIGTGATAEDKKADAAKDVYNQGDLITVCVFPGAEALSDGLNMDSILDFTWYRSLPVYIEQPAIQASQKETAIGLTDFDGCEPLVCVFSSILMAQYYATVGEVAGSGQATLQFPNANVRRLADGNGNRRLQEEPPTLSEFDLTVSANAVNDGPGALATGSGSATLGFSVTVMGLIASLFV